MTDARLRRGRGSLAFAFLAQGTAFALLVTRIPAIQDRYGIGDGLLPLYLAAVPVLAGLGSLATERLVRRVPPSRVLRWSQPAVLLSLLALTTGREPWQAAAALCLFGLAVGALDASMNMLGVSLQQACGRSIMLGFHAAFSLGGILGASLAWVGAYGRLPLVVPCLPVALVLGPAVLAASRWYVDAAPAAAPGGRGNARTSAVPFGVLAPLCLVMAFAYIGDATVANWSAKYVQDVLGGSEALATVPYSLYMATTLIGRTAGDRAAALRRRGRGARRNAAGRRGFRPRGRGSRALDRDGRVHAARTGAVRGRAPDLRRRGPARCGRQRRGRRPAERLHLRGLPRRLAARRRTRRRLELPRGHAGADGARPGDAGVRPVVRRSTGPIR